MLTLFGVQQHRSKSFKLSTDPLFVDKVKDIVGLDLNPPDHAVVLCVDEKTQAQTWERTQPVLPLGLGHLEGVTHDYVTPLFAALDIANGQVLTWCRSRHRHQEFLGFLKHIEAKVPSDLDVHLVVDNYAAHKLPKVRAWLAAGPRFHVHYTPTFASWLTRSNAGSRSLPKVRYAELLASVPSSRPTTPEQSHLSGPLQAKPSSKRLNVYVKLFAEQDTRDDRASHPEDGGAESHE